MEQVRPKPRVIEKKGHAASRHYMHPVMGHAAGVAARSPLTALVESEDIGEGTLVWAYAHILPGARIGRDCNICDHTFIERSKQYLAAPLETVVESGASIGANATILP